MEEIIRKDAEEMATETIKVAREAEALEIYLMLEEAIEQQRTLEEFRELLKARIQAIK